MSNPPDETRRYSARHFAAGVLVCPSCLVHLQAQAEVCPSCRFTGGDTMKMFPLALPPLQPLLDAANLWSIRERKRIGGRMGKIRKRFPEIRWSVCSVDAGEIPNLRLFAFWMLNASPLAAGETAEERASTVLIVINGARGRTALSAGYAVEPWLSDDQWTRLLGGMAVPWHKGKRGTAVVRFFEDAEASLRQAWKRVRLQLKRSGNP